MIPIAEPALGEGELNNVIQAVKSGWISSRGKFIPQFEEGFARYCGVKYGVATSNGTAALHLALKALGIGKGDQVIVPTLTFIATANAVTYCNARPVFVDSHPDYWCLDPEKLEEKITPKTKAIIPVHLYGHPCDMDEIINVAQRHNLYVIEDAAEAHGAEYKGRKVGSLGHTGCFSFYGNKIITTGEGGMCLTDDKRLSERMRVLRDHGMSTVKKYWHDEVGFNYRMTNMQAAVGVAQLEKLDEFVAKKRQIARWYSDGLKRLEENGLIKLHPEMPWAKSVFWLYSILLNESLGSTNGFMQRLAEKGVEARPLFYPLTDLPPYASRVRFPVAQRLRGKGISLPGSVKLTEEDAETVVRAVEEVIMETSSQLERGER